jgi:hypothetical protein
MLFHHSFLTKGGNKVAVSRDIFDFGLSLLKDLIFLISAVLSLQLNKLRFSFFDSLANFLCILLPEVVSVPVFFLVSEDMSYGPKPVSKVEFDFKLVDFWNVRDLKL